MSIYDERFDYCFKILLIGPCSTGKTSILNRLVNDSFTSLPNTTLGVDFFSKIFDINGVKVKFQIWDTAGQERFKSIVQQYYRNIIGVMYVFDLDDFNSLNKLKKITDDFLEKKKDCDYKIFQILVGNKLDIINKKNFNDSINYKQINDFCLKYKIKYYEISAKENTNITTCFKDFAFEILNYVDNNIEELKNNKEVIRYYYSNFQLNESIKKNRCCIIL